MSSYNSRVKDLLESMIDSIKGILHMPISIGTPYNQRESSALSEMCVIVGFNGDNEGRIVIEGGIQTFAKLGEGMFGMALEGEMLESFAGEFANIVCGTMCTSISNKSRKIDITPPTVLTGEMKIYGLDKAVTVPCTIQDIGQMNIVLNLHDRAA